MAGPQDGAARGHRVNNELLDVLEASRAIPGWTRNEDAEEIARVSLSLGDDPVIVEIGAFMGCCTVLLAGPRHIRGSGTVHCIDPFDGSGDAFSVPHYRQILESLGGGPLQSHFEANISRAGLGGRVIVHQGRATEIAARWTRPIDLLLLDGDQSPEGARAAYESWESFLKPDGIIVLRNTRPRDYAAGHDGHRRLAVEEILPPRYYEVRQVRDTTFARRANQTADGPGYASSSLCAVLERRIHASVLLSALRQLRRPVRHLRRRLK